MKKIKMILFQANIAIKQNDQYIFFWFNPIIVFKSYSFFFVLLFNNNAITLVIRNIIILLCMWLFMQL